MEKNLICRVPTRPTHDTPVWAKHIVWFSLLEHVISKVHMVLTMSILSRWSVRNGAQIV